MSNSAGPAAISYITSIVGAGPRGSVDAGNICEALSMDERTFRPDEMLVFAPVTTYSIRITGPNLDVSLGIASAEDIEIFEKLLAKIRASVSASSDSGKV